MKTKRIKYVTNLPLDWDQQDFYKTPALTSPENAIPPQAGSRKVEVTINFPIFEVKDESVEAEVKVLP